MSPMRIDSDLGDSPGAVEMARRICGITLEAFA
jgi:hypothetical protein